MPQLLRWTRNGSPTRQPYSPDFRARRSSDFKPLWSKIKGVYIELQNSKCCFCEKLLEGNIEQDVEHFRPKAEVMSWTVPPRLSAEGITVQQRADGLSEPGYWHLAYSPFNYAMACKTCNSTLKKNFFPFTNCLRSFERLYGSNQTRGEEIAEACLKVMKTKSTGPRRT